jgi:hypothetical protein
MSRNRILDEIRRLAPERDDQRIVYLSTCYDFPFDTTRALEFALFRTFAVPSISALLDRTGEFQNRAQKRYDDTDIIVSELMERGYDSDRGRRALRRMNVRFRADPLEPAVRLAAAVRPGATRLLPLLAGRRPADEHL